MSEVSHSATNPPQNEESKTSTSLSRATDPATTVWVSANAGSGKTYVLSRRVIRLLLEGARPSELLCLTFTKVAAAEMSNRVFKILGDWVQLDDVTLAEAILEITGKPVQKVHLHRARELFATALDTPGGLRVQTIHAFCESLLHQFPLEANIPGHFDMMSETDQALLMDEARRRVILAGLGISRPIIDSNMTDGDSVQQRLAKAYETLQAHASDATIEKALGQIIGDRDAFTDWVEDGGGLVSEAFAKAWETFGMSPDQELNDLYKEFAQQTAYSATDLNALTTALSEKGGTKAEAALLGLQKAGSTHDYAAAHAARCDTFLVDKWAGRRAFFVSKPFMKTNEFFDLFQQEQTILLEQLDRLKTLEVLKASEALFEAAWAMLSEYGNLKQERGLLDFSDLISKTLNLLSRSEIAAWVQFKLDAGIHHVLVDEAQDTSPAQWKIIRLITGDFYSGAGAREGVRTLFVVGDEKQSIFSFQGADPAEFDKQYREITKLAKQAGQDPDRVPLTTSYRSTDDVLSAVDQVFALPENRSGLSSDEIPPSHTANREGQPGDVYVWPMVEKQKEEPRDNWNDPPDRSGSKAAESKLAARIADTIEGWIKNRETLPAHERPIREGDILILVRKRDRFVKAMNMALKDRGLKAAGADRLKLTEHIAVEDMIALGRFACAPADDLSLAGLLKSPLFGFDEDRLMQVAMKREGMSLLQSIEKRSESDEGLKPVLDTLKQIVDTADRVPVYEFYAQLFARHGLRARYLERLGNEVEDIFDGFFQTLIDYDGGSSGGLGLLDFVEWLANAAPDLKREIELESNEIRVITAHSSKGLEKPIVFLVDPGSEAFVSQHAPAIIKLNLDSTTDFPLWQSKKKWHIKACEPALDALRLKAEEEYRRLLYVGMTRAADRLIVCGYGAENIRHSHWQSMVLKGLQEATQTVDGTTGDKNLPHKKSGSLSPIYGDDGDILQYKWQIERDHVRMADAEPTATSDLDALRVPDWIGPAEIERPAPRPLSPSGVLEMMDILPDREDMPASANTDALLKGNLTHQLLQALPDLPENERHAFAKDWLEHCAGRPNPALRETILESVNRVLSAPQLAPLFAPESREEVEIAGTLKLRGQSRAVNGKIDRLVVGENEILVADYKTNWSVPDRPEAVPEQYLAQMALYCELLKKVYHNKPVSALLVWTQDASVMRLPTELLDQQMERLNKS